MHLNENFFEKLIFWKLLKPVIIIARYVKPNGTMAIDKSQRSRLTFDLSLEVTLIHCHRPEAFYQILTCLIWALRVHVTYLFTKCITESSGSPDWLIQYCLSSTSSRVTEMVSMKMPCGECFQKCLSAYNMISLWLNTVIPIIVMIWLPKMTQDISIEGLSVGI